MTATKSWRDATNLVALDLEGSGAQDGDQEAILEIAAIRLITGRPDLATAYTTLINPGRPIPQRPWISPGLTNTTLTRAPSLDAVMPHLTARLNGAILVGHNIGVDWRLLHRRCPHITISGLIDTHRLAKKLPARGKRSLTALLHEHDLTAIVDATAPGSHAHRALWDTIGAALLLDTLTRIHWNTEPTLEQLLDATNPTTATKTLSLFDAFDDPSDQGSVPGAAT